MKILLADELNKRAFLKKSVSQNALSKEIKRICEVKDNNLPDNSLLGFIKDYIAMKKDFISYSTYKRYIVFFKLIERFDGYMAKRFCIESIDMNFVRDFLAFGKTEEYSENTLYRTIHFIKTILNFAEKKGIRTQVWQIEVRREKQYKEIAILNEKEIDKINKTVVPEELQAAKDWLMISCYTGQRISDFMSFSCEQLETIEGKTCITFIQKKTRRQITLPLHPAVHLIISKHKNQFPEKMNSSEYNKKIKLVAKKADLKDIIYTNKRIGHRVKKLALEKWEVLTSHIGRRSFASNFYGKIPTPLLMEATGHTTEQMFQKYINLVNKERILSLNHYFEQTYQEKIVL
ncbi:tyrosine-type recombinase/integrase [Chryseobacterium aurantiacum]|uniref:tyrosine-type recombinase/integrase n=1 Tax=Chryseobacterium aurantiacum TaxID=2116499 RepID=UPI001E46DE2D|nr:tyrosine-type recombinase/integrase [Chryseobacterium aurantiacum]